MAELSALSRPAKSPRSNGMNHVFDWEVTLAVACIELDPRPPSRGLILTDEIGFSGICVEEALYRSNLRFFL